MSIRTTSTSPSVSQAVAGSIDQIANGAEHAIESVRERVGPSAARLVSHAEDLAHRGYDAVREKTEHLRDRAAVVTERSTQYVKDEPVKAVLMAAAAGALLMALVTTVRRSSRHRNHYAD